MRKTEWVVYAKQPFAGPQAVLAYLSRYTHRVAISNRRLIKADATGVTFRYKDYRRDGPARYTAMTLTTDEFIRRFLMHVLPKGLHRIRHYGLFANGNRAANIARARDLLGLSTPDSSINNKTSDAETSATPDDPHALAQPCPCCGGPMMVIEVFVAGSKPRHCAKPEGIDSS